MSIKRSMLLTMAAMALAMENNALGYDGERQQNPKSEAWRRKTCKSCLHLKQTCHKAPTSAACERYEPKK